MNIESRPVVIITGAARGIGLAAVGRFLDAGYDVLAVDLLGAPFEDLPAVTDGGPSIQTVNGDVSSDQDWERVITVCRDRFGRLDALFNNAGIEGALGSMLDYPLEEFDRVMAINVRGVFLGMRHTVEFMRETGGGSIINNASNMGVRGSANIIGYSASKHAVVGLTRSAAIELAPTIRVNAVCPSPTNTRMMWDMHDRVAADTTDDEFERAFTATTPMGRFAEADEIADAVLYLAGSHSSFVTGAILPVDGGNTAG
jgi:NAD(P)-dependent dehydrogenase (short-subunit alcohol dehydrogenase family)